MKPHTEQRNGGVLQNLVWCSSERDIRLIVDCLNEEADAGFFLSRIPIVHTEVVGSHSDLLFSTIYSIEVTVRNVMKEIVQHMFNLIESAFHLNRSSWNLRLTQRQQGLIVLRK